MKKTFTLLPFLVAFFTTSIAFAQVPIIDYYNLLADYDDDVKLHKVFEESGKWYTTNSEGQKVQITVDAKQNFLEIKDKEFGGIFSMQLSLYKKNGGEIFIGLTKNHLDNFLHGEIHILKLRNGRWNDVTEEVMPEITYKDFTEQTLSLAAAAFNPQLNHHLEFGYQLPRDGHAANAVMQTQIIKEKCANGDASVSEYCGSLHEIRYSNIELTWNAQEGKFVLGNKQ